MAFGVEGEESVGDDGGRRELAGFGEVGVKGFSTGDGFLVGEVAEDGEEVAAL